MKLDIARQPFGVTVTSLAVLAAFFSLRHNLSPDPCEIISVSDMPLDRIIDSLGLNSGSTAGRILTVMVVLVNSIMLTRIANRNMLYVIKAYLPATLYLLISSGIYFAASSLSVHLAAMLIILALARFFSSFRREINAGGCFTGGLLTGIATLFYGNVVVLIPFIHIALSLLRRSWRENVLAVTGALIPLFICAYTDWILGRGFTDIFVIIRSELDGGFDVSSIASFMNPFRLISIAILILLLFLSVGSYIGNVRTMRTRPARLILVIILLLGAFAPLVLFESSPAIIAPFWAIPLSLLIPVYFVRNGSFAAALLYIGLIIAVIALNGIQLYNQHPLVS